MSIEILPSNFADLLTAAVEVFWRSRTQGSDAQPGGRGSVISGKNMDGFVGLLKAVATHCGLPEESIYTKSSSLTLPGYYRPCKNWDVLVIHKRRLIAAFEFKSQVGSFSNNFNNRCEEAIGTAADLWVALQHKAYDPENFATPTPSARIQRNDPRPPFIGYLMLLHDCAESTTPVQIRSPHFKTFPEFAHASYAERYPPLCERLMEQNLYQAASLLLSPAEEGTRSGQYRAMSAATDARNLFLGFAARAVVAAQD